MYNEGRCILTEFKPTKTEKTVISIRLDVDILNKVDALANKADISRNEFILQCIDYALKNIDTK